jgi:DUF971 family protein
MGHFLGFFSWNFVTRKPQKSTFIFCHYKQELAEKTDGGLIKTLTT